MSDAAASARDWIAVDWGTTHLRAWLVSGAGTVKGRVASDRGMSVLGRQEFEPVLLQIVDPWLDTTSQTQVICCGMAGSRQGWIEAPYRDAPCEPFGDGELVRVAAEDERISVVIIPGIKQNQPADVMRGEETQVIGLLACLPDFDGVVCLPGTHSKWVRVSAGEVVGFTTYLTGEMFSLLAHKSVLRHSVGADGWDADAFRDALNDAIAKPEMIAARLFGLRADALVGNLRPQTARARLSGYLIGLELAAARPYWLGQRVSVVGAEPLCDIYACALDAQGLTPETFDAEALTIAGLSAVHSTLNQKALSA